MRYPILITIPHCSTVIPDEIRSTIALDEREINQAMDIGTGEIFGTIPAVRVLPAMWSRLVVDLNRTPTRRDKKGVIAKTDYHGRKIFKSGMEPDEAETLRRVERYYRPFHSELSECLENSDVKALFDCHSLNGTGPRDAPDRGNKRMDITISNYGDRKGEIFSEGSRITCPPEKMHAIKEAFEDCGFSVSLNYPYRGGFIMYHYGHEYEKSGKVAVQVELNQDLFRKGQIHEADPVMLAEAGGRISKAFESIAGLF